MNEIDALKAKIKKAEDRVSKLKAELKEVRLNLTVKRPNCNQESKVKNIPAISGMRCDNQPYSENWYVSSRYIICPLCIQACKVSYDEYIRKNEIKITEEMWYDFPFRVEAEYLDGFNFGGTWEKACKKAIDWIKK